MNNTVHLTEETLSDRRRDQIMDIQVKLYASLKQKQDDQLTVSLPMASTVQELLQALKIPEADIGVIMINSRSGSFKQQLFEGDRVTLIPPIDGG